MTPRSGFRASKLLSFQVVLWLACGPKQQANPPGSLPDIVGATTDPEPAFRRADLDYMIKENGKPVGFLMPMIRATVGGVETQLMIDSGTNTHVITGWLARRAGLDVHTLGDKGTDHTGRALRPLRATDPNIRLETWGPLKNQPALVNEVPDRLERMGIGGFISPQQLATEDKYVVVDLEHAEMRTATKDDLPKIQGTPLGRGEARSCIDDSTPLRTRSFLVKGSIEAHDVSLLVNTGAAVTDIRAESEAGKALFSRTEKSGDELYTAGGKVGVRLFKNAKLALGDLESIHDVYVMSTLQEEPCPRDGSLAMDVLRHCVLIFGVTSMQGFCKK